MTWDNHTSDPISDIKKAMEKAVNQPYRPPVLLHSPRCKAVSTQNTDDCNCALQFLFSGRS